MAEVAQQSRWVWPFELLEKIGEGGMGVVYRARFVKNDKIVAVKLLPPDLDKEVVKARFERELEILKELRHPNIVFCFGGTTKGDQQFYAMELVDGGTLDELLETRGKLSWGEVVNLGGPMCQGLAFAHERGVIHRDIKPGNFLLTKSGQPKLADFGLATVVAATKLTMAGKTLGTLRYMSPEQIRGKDLSPQSDIYSLGCVFYQMLTGHPPHDGDSPAEIMQAHLKNIVPPIRTAAPDCPKEMEDLILQMLKKDADDRPATAIEVAQKLQSEPQISVSVSAKAIAEMEANKSAPRAMAHAMAMQKATGSIPAWVVATGLLALTALLFSVVWLSRGKDAGDDAIESWVELYRTADNVRLPEKLHAAEVLGRIARKRAALVDMFVEDLSADDPFLRQAAAVAIGYAGTNGLSASTDLLALSKKDGDQAVQRAAAAARARLKTAEAETSSWPYWTIIGVMLALMFVLMRTGHLPAPGFLAPARLPVEQEDS